MSAASAGVGASTGRCCAMPRPAISSAAPTPAMFRLRHDGMPEQCAHADARRSTACRHVLIDGNDLLSPVDLGEIVGLVAADLVRLLECVGVEREASVDPLARA